MARFVTIQQNKMAAPGWTKTNKTTETKLSMEIGRETNKQKWRRYENRTVHHPTVTKNPVEFEKKLGKTR